ncbi:DUF3375 family protein [Chitinimonas arctica]|nr:DUF3375 family protein [Chitinimonas arctica]
MDILHGIESKALALRESPPPGNVMEMAEAQADIELAMERPLFTPAVKPVITDLALQAGEEDIDAQALFDQVVLDKAHLIRHIHHALQDKAQITLSELVATQPLQQGLAELVAYLGVHSKFIESHRSVLAELLDLSLPVEGMDLTKTGVGQFSARYGFLGKPIRIRSRILDPGVQVVPGISCPDITLDADSFSQLKLEVRRVFITENETNFLAFPCVSGSMIVFGSGYGWEALAKARWLERCEVYYWGDIDTHGFAILDKLRKYFPHVTSLSMDRDTLQAYSELWGIEDKPQCIDLHRLTREEHELYNDLRDNRIRANLRLEQEHIGFDWVRARLDLLR